MEGSERKIRITNMRDPIEDDLHGKSVAELIGMMWPLAVESWAFKGEDVTQQRFQRHIISLQRR